MPVCWRDSPHAASTGCSGVAWCLALASGKLIIQGGYFIVHTNNDQNKKYLNWWPLLSTLNWWVFRGSWYKIFKIYLYSIPLLYWMVHSLFCYLYISAPKAILRGDGYKVAHKYHFLIFKTLFQEVTWGPKETMVQGLFRLLGPKESSPWNQA
jgi:hypothetical protein